MNKGGIGVGSASIVLVFSVLCLTIFALIAFIVAGNSKALVDAESRLVIGFYETDALAEQILAELSESDTVPPSIQGVEMQVVFDYLLGADVVEFSCPVLYTCPVKERDTCAMQDTCPTHDTGNLLHVRVLFTDDSYQILSWRMGDDSEWLIDDALNVWIDI